MTWLRGRILQAIPLLWGLITLLFCIIHVLGDPSRMIAGQRSDLSTLASVRKSFRLDLPLWQQYLWYLNDLSPVGYCPEDKISSQSPLVFYSLNAGVVGLKKPDLGRSFQTNRPVLEMIFDKLPGTLALAIFSMLFAILVGISCGVWAAVRKGQWPDRVVSFLAMLGVSAPSFTVAVILIWLLAVRAGSWTGLPVSGYLLEEDTFGTALRVRPETLILPVLALGLRPLSLILQLTRNSMLEVLGLDYIRSARAKGLSERQVIWKHGLRNALNPVITAVSGWFASLLAGVFFIEFMFDWQGMGKLTLEALHKSDYPVLSGCVLFTGLSFILMNLIADGLYALADPRVK
jgi:peptide/nickel transport system permease protein